MTKTEADLLVERIKKAWDGVVYPGDENIFTPHSYDDEGITEYFSGTTWEGHSVRSLRGHSSAISTFFTPVAYHYWLPAYLIAAITDLDELDAGYDALLSSLIPEIDGSISQSDQLERFGLLTDDQKHSVIDTLEFTARLTAPNIYTDTIAEEKIALHHLYSITYYT